MTNKPINKIERSDVEAFRDITVLRPANALDYYQHIAVKSAIYPGQGTPFGLMYAGLGLAEAGEVQNKIKKAFRDDGVLQIVDEHQRETCVRYHPLPEERRRQIIKEMGGMLWYMAACCEELGTTLSEVALSNLDELCSRTERGTLQGDGDNR